MAKRKMNLYCGIASLIAVALLYVPIPLISGEKTIAAITMLVVGLYLIIKNN